MDKIKISDHQLFSLTAGGALGGSVMVIASLSAMIAKQDAWIVELFNFAFGIPIVWMYCFLGSKYPEVTFIGLLKKIFGKWIGIVFALGYIFLCIHTSTNVIWYIGNFMTTQVMPETPAYAINLLFVICILIAVLYGIETIARTSELIIKISSVLFFVTMVLDLPNAKVENLQPVLENGIMPALKSSVFLSSVITFPLITLLMIYPVNISNIKRAKKAIFKGYALAGVIVFITLLMSILILGPALTAKSQYPAFLLAKLINIGSIFTRVEFIVTGNWILTEFIIATLFFYAGTLGLAELLKLKDYRIIAAPLGLIVLVIAGFDYPNVMYEANFIISVHPLWLGTYGLIVPILLLIVFLVRKWFSNIIS